MKITTLVSLSTTALFALALSAPLAMAQNYPGGGRVAPNQPVQPQNPAIIPRGQQPPQQPMRPQQPQAPFTLTPQQEAALNQVLGQWEQKNKEIKTFDCQFKRWIYDVVFGKPNEPKFIELGLLKFAAPDRGLFHVDREEKNGQETKIEPAREEHWICDGKTIWEVNAQQQKVKEHKLPPELQGKAIANSPLPFLFGAEANNLKQRYFIRIATPPDVKDQIWLETYPRFQQDAANFHHAVFIITAADMRPFALRLVQPNGKDYMVYQFYDIKVNDALRFFKGDPFRPSIPFGWKLIPDTTPQQPAQPKRRY